MGFSLKKKFIKYFVNKILFPYIKGSKRFKYYNFLKKKQWDKIEHIKAYQKRKLFCLVDYAYRNNSYYRNIIENRNIEYSKETIFSDLKKFPVLTKEDLKDNFDQLKSLNFNDKYYKNTSGGSTGEPVLFLQDQNYRDWNAAGKLLYYNWAGSNPEDKVIKLWGSERDIEEGGQGLRGFLVKHLVNTEVLNTFKMSENDMKEYVDIINHKKPEVVEAYVQSVYEIVKYIKKEKLSVYSPNGIITSAGMLYKNIREQIEEIFETRVYNRYGSREVGDIACSCEHGDSLHINQFFNYVEINKKQQEEFGSILVTNLHNRVMPLIRYKIGDQATKKIDSDCRCDRELQLIEKLKGREVNIFVNKKGDLIDGEYFTHLIYFKENVDRFQFVQKEKNKIILKVEPPDALSKQDRNDIKRKIKKVMGSDCKIDIVGKKKILPTDSGKHLYTISEVKKNN